MRKIIMYIFSIFCAHSMMGMNDAALHESMQRSVEAFMHVIREEEARKYASITHGVAETVGLRKNMEDETDVHLDSEHAFFAVYDGHGGREVATFAKAHLHTNCDLAHAVTHAMVPDALINGFLKTNNDWNGRSTVGSTATVAVIKHGRIFVANAGDSRTVLCRAGKAIALSHDHKPESPIEYDRIIYAGGSVECVQGVWRVNRVLAVSRALGDHHLKGCVTSRPDITTQNLSLDDEFLILGCDGLWDVMTNDAAVSCVRNCLAGSNNDCKQAAAQLMIGALKQGSTDNISTIVVNLKSFLAK